MGDVIAVTGTRREAAVLRGSGVRAMAIGGLADGLSPACIGVHPVCGIVSFGMAGALSPDLRIGDWVIGTRVYGDATAECDPLWREALARAMPQARSGAIFADGRLISDPDEKLALHNRHGALAADMESHLAAKAAAKAGVPFAVLRCISDEAAHALPPAIAVAMRPDGGLALGAILKSILRNPAQLPQIATTLRSFGHAYGALRRGGEAIPGRLAFDQR